jgi:polyhydroxyalkanoate synthesis regulator phasin
MPSASADANDDNRGHMDDPGNDLFDERDPLDRLIASLGVRLDEMRSLFDEATSRWRGDALRLGEETRQRANSLFYELGLITREDWDELDLRVAQLEHRLRLIEERLDRD